MNYKQEDYHLSVKENEYFEVMNVIRNLIKKSKEDDNYPVWGEMLEKLLGELEENQGQNMTPWQYNMIIYMLLGFTPESLKKD